MHFFHATKKEKKKKAYPVLKSSTTGISPPELCLNPGETFAKWLTSASAYEMVVRNKKQPAIVQISMLVKTVLVSFF